MDTFVKAEFWIAGAKLLAEAVDHDGQVIFLGLGRRDLAEKLTQSIWQKLIPEILQMDDNVQNVWSATHITGHHQNR